MASSAQPGTHITRHWQPLLTSHFTHYTTVATDKSPTRQPHYPLPHYYSPNTITRTHLSQNTIHHILVIGHPSTATLHPHNFQPRARALTLAHSSISPARHTTALYHPSYYELLRALHYSRTFSNYRPKTAYHRHLSSYFQDTPLQGPVTQDKRATSHLASHTTPYRTRESSHLPNIPSTQDGVFKF